MLGWAQCVDELAEIVGWKPVGDRCECGQAGTTARHRRSFASAGETDNDGSTVIGYPFADDKAPLLETIHPGTGGGER